MAGVVEVALRSLVDQVIARREAEAGGTEPNNLRLVVLMAFAFTGGPLDGSSTILEPIKSLIDTYAAANVLIELVLPIGNHRQDQLHASLNPGNFVGWRILPDDHSANTLEVIQNANGATLSISEPQGTFVPVPLDTGLFRMKLDGESVGSVWTEAISGNRLRTRISLASTGTIQTGAPIAPFGRWRITTSSSNVKLWVLRDETGFEADPSQPSRASWLEDKHYRKKDDKGEPNRVDEGHFTTTALSSVSRVGSASVLAASAQGNPNIVVVTALEDDDRPAFYAGVLPGAAADFETKLSDPDIDPDMNPIGPFIGRAVLGNAGKNRFRGLGTSMAAAIKAGELANN